MKKITKKVLSGILLCGMLTAGVLGAQLVHAAVVSEPDANGVYHLTEGDELNLKIHLIGDINGDGKCNAKDRGMVNEHVNKITSLTEYAFDCADVNGDGKVNAKDRGLINEHVNKINLLW